ncbi:MAG: energy transducer TonB [bacterium]|nr:energy transducer TonB [bacterium]
MPKFIICIVSFAFLATVASAQTEERDRGIDLYQAGKFDDAVVVLEKVVAANPDKNKVAWTYLGGAFMNLGRRAEAIEAFGKPVGGPPGQTVEKSIKIIRKEPARYTEKARSNKIEGTVFVVVELKADGKIGFVVPIKELPDGLTDNVIASAKSIKFSPAVRNGIPVTQIRMLSYSFDTY